MSSERDLLIEALTPSLKLYEQQTAGMTLAGRPGPEESILGPIAAAIEQCPSYSCVAGKMLYSAYAGVVLQPSRLAGDLFGWAQFDVSQAADWLLRVLNTKTANGLFLAAIWGLALDEEIQVSPTSRLIRFSALRKSSVKDRIEQRARPNSYKAPWLAHTFYDKPGVAFITEVHDLPYISADGSPFKIMEKITREASEIWSMIQAVSVGHPLAIGHWFEYDDRDLDISAWENSMSWSLPEVVPQIRSATLVDTNAIQDQLRQYRALPTNLRRDLLRSMDRFILSQCRQRATDRILDLALAFEIAVSGERSSAPISWKISHRSAQFIGGPLETRRSNRKIIADLYASRSSATHGGSTEVEGDSSGGLSNAAELYRAVLKSYLKLGKQPDWVALELEPLSRSFDGAES